MVSAAYQKYQIEQNSSSSVGLANLTPYLNYASIIPSSGAVLNDSVTTTIDCDNAAGHYCVRMQNGSTLIFNQASNFGGTGSSRVNWFIVDPIAGASPSGGDAVWCVLFLNGTITSAANIQGSVQSVTGTYTSSADPSWFDWY